jgi:hypothetical protein
MSAMALRPTAVTQATRPAALVELRVAARAVALQHAHLRGAVAVAALADLPVQVPAGLLALVQADLVAAALADLLVQGRRADSLRRAGLRALVLPVGQAVLLQASAHRARLRVAHRVVVEHRAARRAVATTGL